MIYEVINKPKKIETALLDSAVSFAVDYLHIALDLIIEFETIRKHQYGLCDYDEDEVIITIAKRLSPKDAIRTLFHELVHVKQYSDGRLQYGNIWLGEKVKDAYENYPWEIEAFKIEAEMMKAFMQ